MSSNPDDSLINAANRWAWQLDDPEKTGQFRPIPRQGWAVIGDRAYFVAELSDFVRPQAPVRRPPLGHATNWRPWTKPRVFELPPPPLIERWRKAKMHEWRKILPLQLATNQGKWEMWHTISRVHDDGMSVAKLSALLGTSTTTIYQGLYRASQMPISPYDRYLSKLTLSRSELRELAKRLCG